MLAYNKAEHTVALHQHCGKCLIQKTQQVTWDELAVTLQMSVIPVHNLFHKELGISKVCRQRVVTSVDT
jgi:methylphosphotriester-DNA--protein-cysteine methyltransferase